MSISTELLNSTFADLRGPLVNSFVRSSELFEALDKKARIPMEGGTLIERTFSGGAPARGVGIYVGDELLNMTRRQEIRKFQVEPHRLAVAINIPKKELQMNSGKLAVIRLIEEYPKSVLEGAKADLNSFLLTGTSRGIVFTTAELAGMLSLNGDVSTGVGTGVTHGLLDWQPPANQGDKVQNVTKSSSYFHFNQYNDISSFAANGMTQLRKTYRQCAHYAGGIGKGPDMIFMDDDTYTNFEDARSNNVRVSVVDEKIDKTNTLGLSLGLASVTSSIDLDRTGFSSPANDGVTYMLNTDFIEFPMLEAPNVSEFKERVGDQDVVTAIFAMQGNMICTKLPAQGVVSGGAV